MAYQMNEYVFGLKDITPTERNVAHVLAWHASKDGTNAYPSMETIAAGAGLADRRCAQRVVRRLEQKGIIRRTGRKGGQYSTGIYEFVTSPGKHQRRVALTENIVATSQYQGGDQVIPAGATATYQRDDLVIPEGRPSSVAQKVSKEDKRKEKREKLEKKPASPNSTILTRSNHVVREDVQAALDWMADHSDCAVTFSAEQIPAVERLLDKYGKSDLKYGFSQFWSNFLRDKPHKRAYATYDFLSTGEQFLRIAQKNRLDAESTKRQMDIEIARLRAENEADSAARAAAEAAEPVDDFFESLKAGTLPEQQENGSV